MRSKIPYPQLNVWLLQNYWRSNSVPQQCHEATRDIRWVNGTGILSKGAFLAGGTGVTSRNWAWNRPSLGDDLQVWSRTAAGLARQIPHWKQDLAERNWDWGDQTGVRWVGYGALHDYGDVTRNRWPESGGAKVKICIRIRDRKV